MRSLEIEHKTIEEAIEKGLYELNLTLENVSVEVLEEGSKGFLGIIGARMAKVRLTEKANEIEIETVKEEIRPKPMPVHKKADKPLPAKQSIPSHKPTHNNETQKIEQTASVQAVKKISTPAQMGQAGEFLTQVAKQMDIDITIVATKEDDMLRLDINGDEKGILIGHRGETLDALQYLANLIHNKNHEGYERLQLDSQNYRKKREETLIRLANRLAEKSRRTHHKITLEPMNPYERRIMHSALQNNPYVTTFSEGDEPNRRVVIQPK